MMEIGGATRLPESLCSNSSRTLATTAILLPEITIICDVPVRLEWT
jgi:hypothetical protein